MGRRGRPRYPDLLTPRQQEVLTLVREGLTNREIAGRLDITPDGVKFHVSEILTKIGVGSREEAARWQADVPTAVLHRRNSRWGPASRRSRTGWRTPRWLAVGSRHHSRGRLCHAGRHTKIKRKLSIT